MKGNAAKPIAQAASTGPSRRSRRSARGSSSPSSLANCATLSALIDGDTDELQALRPKLALSANEFGHLFAARSAPGRPEIDDQDFASPLSQRLRGSVRSGSDSASNADASADRGPKAQARTRQRGPARRPRQARARSEGVGTSRELALTPPRKLVEPGLLRGLRRDPAGLRSDPVLTASPAVSSAGSRLRCRRNPATRRR